MRTRGLGIGALGMLLAACGEHGPTELLGQADEATHTPNVNVSDQISAQSEAAIAVNPADPLEVVAVANNLADLTQLGVWYSDDGGDTWNANFIDENVDGLDTGDQRFDPNVAFDSDGNVYVVYSTKNSQNTLVVARSTDGGQNFDLATTVTTDAGLSNLHTGMVTTREDPSGDDDVLVVWARVQPGDESIEAALSLDAGASYTVTNTQINDALQRTFLPWAEVDAAGNFAVIWEVNQNSTGTGFIYHDTLDGTTLTSGTDNTVTGIQITDFLAPTSLIPAAADRGLFSVATVDVDRTTGRLIVGYTDRTDNTTDDTNIFVRTSDDGGAIWSDPIQINDDATTTSQFLPRIALDQSDQTLYAIWYDARNDTANNQRVNVFSSFSTDGGDTWSENHQLSDEESDESTANAQRNGNNYAEYAGLSAENGVAHVVWTDARDANFTTNLNEEIFTTRFTTNEPPVAVCTDFPVAVDAACQATISVADIDAGSFDPDGPPPNCTLSSSGPFGPGNFTVTLTCEDADGDTDDCTATVFVADETPPVLVCPSSVNVPCTGSSGAVATFSTSATDNCGGLGTPVCAPASGSTFPLGTTLDTCTVTDAGGNPATCSFQVTVALGDNSACCPAGTNIILGNSNNNTLNGTSGSDCILGRGAQDTINGNGGNDFISGGEGDDIINGGTGNDVCFGGAGQDRLNGGSGDDVLSGGDGDDQCFGGDNNDTLLGGQHQDRLFGENGNDRLIGEGGDDRLEGGAGDDVLDGSGLHDVCIGGTGTDSFLVCESQTQ